MDIQTRHERSLVCLILQTLIRPFKPLLTAPTKIFPPESQKLTPLKAFLKIVQVDERQVDNIYVYDISARRSNAAADSAKTALRLYYFAGGGWQMPPSSQHWEFCAHLAMEVPGLVVSVVSAPLAPKSPATMTLPQLHSFCISVLDQSADAGERVLFGGDSSGGNIALSLALKGAMKNPPDRSPHGLLLICPACDLNPMREDEEISRIVKKDPVLTARSHNKEAENWCRQSDRSDPLISPVYADMSVLAQAEVHVIGVTGGYDILTPDALKLRDNCQKSGMKGAWLHWERQMHCFPLTFGYHIPEGVQAMEWIVDQLTRT